MSEAYPINSHASPLEPELAAAVRAIVSDPLDSAAIERVKNRAKGLVEKTSLAPPTVRRWQAPRAWIALAASLLAVVGLTSVLPATPNALGQALAQLRSARAFQFTRVLFIKDADEPFQSKVFVAEDGRQREEAAGVVTIHDSSGRSRLTLISETRQAIVPARSDQPAGRDQWLHHWLEALRNHRDAPSRQLPDKNLSGRQVQGFVVEQRPHEFTLWIDRQSQELVQLEFGPLVEGSAVTKVVLRDFRFDVELDDSLFSFDVPAGYTTKQLPAIPEIVAGQQHIVEALRYYTQASRGKFPDSIADWGEWAVLISADGESTEAEMQAMGHVGAILPFLTSKSADDYQYVGQGKSVNDPRTIVFWWRDDAQKLWAIYSDFTIDEIAADERPSAPAQP